MPQQSQRFQPGQILTTPDGEQVEFVRYDEEGKAVVRPVSQEGTAPSQADGDTRGKRIGTDPYDFERFGRDAGIVGRSAVQGATFGFSDELRGLLGAVGKGEGEAETFGERYRASRDTEREALAQAREDAPILSVLGEMGGGVATGFGAAGGLRVLGSKAGGLLARGASKVMGSPATRAGRVQRQEAVRGAASKFLTPAARQAPAKGAGIGARAAHKLGQAKDVITTAGPVQAAKAARVAEAGGTGGGAGSRIWGGMKLGAAEGGLYGAGMGGGERDLTFGESLKSRLGTGAGGATLGVAGAGLLGGAAAGAGRLGKFASQALGKKSPIKMQATADEAIIRSLMEEDPQKFLIGGRAWVDDINKAIKDPTPENLQKVALADKKAAQKALKKYKGAAESEIYAGARNAQREAVIRESQPGAVAGLLADTTEDLSRTAAQASTMVGKQQGALKEAVRSRPNPVNNTLDEIQRASQTPKSPGSARQRLGGLEEERRALAKVDYDTLYETKGASGAQAKAELQAIVTDQQPGGLWEFTETLRRAVKRDPGVADRIRAGGGTPGEAAAILAGKKGGGVRLRRTLGQMLKDPAQKGPRGGRAAGKVNADMKDLDLLRRALKNAERELKSMPGGGDETWEAYRLLADDLDDAIAKHSDQYATTRKNYEVSSSKINSYEKGAAPYSRAEDLADAYDNAHIRTGKDATRTPNFTNAQKAKIKAEFRQGRLDAVADEANAKLRSNPDGLSAIKYLEDQFAMMFDPPNGAFRDLMSPAEIAKARNNLQQRFRQAQTTQAVSSASPAGIAKSAGAVEGSTEAMGVLYLGAGQAGAAGRTLVQSRMYSDASKKAIASALSRRLRQKESTGLLRAAESLGDTELKRLRGLLSQKGTASGGAMGAASTREAYTGDARYGGYRPRESRRRGLLQERMRERDERMAAENQGR